MVRFAGRIGVFLLAAGVAALLWNLIVGTAIVTWGNPWVDPDLGKVYGPNEMIVHGREGLGINRMDSLGFNNAPQASGRVDVLVLGDSTTEALQVDRPENFVSQTESLLSSRGHPAGVYNAGHSGLGPPDYLATADGFVRRLGPHFIVLQLSRGDLDADLTGVSGGSQLLKVDGSWAVKPVPARGPSTSRNRLLKASPLGILFGQWMPGDFQSFLGPRSPFLPASSAPKASVAAKFDMELLTWFLGQMQVKFNGKLAVLFVRYAPSLDNKGGVALVSEKDEVAFEALDLACKKVGVPLIDTKVAFLALALQQHRFPRGLDNSAADSGHLNAFGHRAVAEALVPYLETVLP